MKRIIKETAAFRSRYGFTLLEVVLAIAIMLILTTMMMNGFAATMSYSYHTSIYAQTAASNYKSAMNEIATKSTAGNAVYKTIDKAGATGDKVTLTMTPVTTSTAFPSTRTMTVRRYMYLKGTESIAQYGYRSQVENYTGGAANDDGTYANNRITYFYVPKVNVNGSEATRGNIRVTRAGTKYYWFDTVNNKQLDEITY